MIEAARGRGGCPPVRRLAGHGDTLGSSPGHGCRAAYRLAARRESDSGRYRSLRQLATCDHRETGCAASSDSPKVCNFRLSKVRNFRSTLTVCGRDDLMPITDLVPSLYVASPSSTAKSSTCRA